MVYTKARHFTTKTEHGKWVRALIQGLEKKKIEGDVKSTGMRRCFTKLPIALGEFSLQMTHKLGFGWQKAKGLPGCPISVTSDTVPGNVKSQKLAHDCINK